MNLGQVEKLRKLVTSSAVLNADEKQEWLALLELMNDKQLLELERILASSSPKPAAKPVAMPLQNISVQPQVTAPTGRVLTEDLKFKKPALGHIINVPKMPARDTLAAQNQKKIPSVLLSGNQQPDKKKSFLEKLKAMIQEPELPPGNTDLELSAPAVEIKPKAQASLVEPVLASAVLVKQPPSVPRPAPAPASLVTENPQTVASAKTPQKVQTVAEILAQEAVKKSKSPEESLAGLKKWPKMYDLKEPKSQAAANAPALLNLKDKPAPVPLSSAVSQNQNAVKATLLKPQSANIREPVDLEKLEVVYLGDNQLDKKLKDMVKHFGYHQVVGHLEKSPLYKNYLHTGQEILQKGQSKGSDGLLEQEYFEKTADLLRNIQAE